MDGLTPHAFPTLSSLLLFSFSFLLNPSLMVPLPLVFISLLISILLYSWFNCTLDFCLIFHYFSTCPYRLVNFMAELSVLKNIEASKTSEKNLNRTFPCAYCRTTLSSNTCVDSGDKNEKAVFNYFLESAIATEMMNAEGVLND